MDNIYLEKRDISDVDLALPLAIQIELTEACNFKCLFCYNDSGVRRKNDICIDQWKNMLFYIKKLGGVFLCVFSGGEPLLYKKELLELMDILHEDKTGMVLITNAYYLDDAFVKKICKYDWYWVQVSLDASIPEVHDEIRGVKGSFDKATEAIRLLKMYGLPVAISSVICRRNITEIEGIVKMASELQVDSVLFSQVLPVGRATLNTELQLDANQKKEYDLEIERVTRIYAEKILVRSAQPYEEQMQNRKLFPPYGLLIRPNGDVKLDCLSKTIIGNVFETPINEIWNTFRKRRGDNI